jgi:hypothetical protein
MKRIMLLFCPVTALQLIAFSAAGGDSGKQPLPSPVELQLQLIESSLDRGFSAMRVEILFLGDGVSVDPPPSFHTFEAAASGIVEFRAEFQEARLREVVRCARRSVWRPVGFRVDARWCVRFRGPWRSTIAEWLIDRPSGAICMNDTWYYVDKALVDAVTVSLLKGIIEDASERVPSS